MCRLVLRMQNPEQQWQKLSCRLSERSDSPFAVPAQHVMPVGQVANGMHICSEVEAALDPDRLSQSHTKSMLYLAGPAEPA